MVLKGRNGLKDLKNAVRSVFEGKRFLSAKLEVLTKRKNIFEVERVRRFPATTSLQRSYPRSNFKSLQY